MSGFPEHDKLKANSAASRTIGDFMEWLATQNLHLARSVGEESRPYPMSNSYIIKRYLGIDQDAFDAEKKAMLNHLEAEERRHDNQQPGSKKRSIA